MAKKEGLFISARARTCVASRQHTLHLAHISGKTLRYKSTPWVRLAWMPMFPGACHLGRTEVLCPFIGVKWRCRLPRAALPPQGCICPPLDSDAALQDVIRVVWAPNPAAAVAQAAKPSLDYAPECMRSMEARRSCAVRVEDANVDASVTRSLPILSRKRKGNICMVVPNHHAPQHHLPD